MTLAEFKKKWAEEDKRKAEAEATRKAAGGKLRFPYGLVATYNEDEEDDEEEEFEEDDTQNLLIAASLLQTAMHHLGFYGDNKLSSGRITTSDAQIMLNTAEEIRVFLQQLERNDTLTA